MLNFLKIKEVNGLDLDSPDTTIIHRNIILKKPFLKKIYINWYQTFIKEIAQYNGEGILEIGSGGGFFKDLYPQVITSDILPLPHCNMKFDAENIPFESNSLNAILMLNVLHHIPNSEIFLKEVNRVLKPKGKLIMIEPATTFFSKIIYTTIHHEPFNIKANWEIPSTGPLSGANGALPWIIFKRDIKKFNNLFPQLKLIKLSQHTPFSYLVSGGVSYKSIFPGWSFPFIHLLEKIMSPINSMFGMFQTIVLEKK